MLWIPYTYTTNLSGALDTGVVISSPITTPITYPSGFATGWQMFVMNNGVQINSGDGDLSAVRFWQVYAIVSGGKWCIQYRVKVTSVTVANVTINGIVLMMPTAFLGQ
jgi:hypothetical protein